MDDEEIAKLREQGLTTRGEKKIRIRDKRCRPPKKYRVCVDRNGDTLPQCLMGSVVDAAHAEDIMMLWAHLTGVVSGHLPRSDFRFLPETYTNDEALIKKLKSVTNAKEDLVSVIRELYPTPYVSIKRTAAEPDADAGESSRKKKKVDSSLDSQERSLWEQYLEATDAPWHHPMWYIHAFERWPKEKPKAVAYRMTPTEWQTYYAGWCAHHNLMQARRHVTGIRALHKAAWDGNSRATRGLVEIVQDVNIVLGETGLTPLHSAVLGGVGSSKHLNVRAVETLLKFGAAVDAQDAHGRTPLHYAMRRKDPAMVKVLLAAGASPNALARDTSTPLHEAAAAGDVGLVSLLLRFGAKEYNGESRCGTALHWAARAGHADVVNFLLVEPRFGTYALDSTNATPLHVAVEAFDKDREDEYVAVIRNLMGHGADVWALDTNRNTPYHRAVARGHRTCARFLLRLGGL